MTNFVIIYVFTCPICNHPIAGKSLINAESPDKASAKLASDGMICRRCKSSVAGETTVKTFVAIATDEDVKELSSERQSL
jgi:hypothetical protein